MTHAKLREKVAMAIAKAEIAYFGPRASREQCMNWANEPNCYRNAADAAIAVVLEEAAQAIEVMYGHGMTREHAAVIRALKENFGD